MMRRRTLTMLMAATIATGVLALPGTPAGAVQPISFEDQIVETFPLAECDVEGESFTVLDSFVLDINGKVYLDEGGEPVKGIVHLMFRGTLFREDDPTRTLRDDGSWTEHVTFPDDGRVWLTGGVAHFTVPGHGVVVLSAGRALVDFSQDPPQIVEGTPMHTNPEEVFATPEVQAIICDYFA